MKVHRCCCHSIIRNTRTNNKILYIFGLRNVISLCRIQNLNSQKIAERTQIRHLKLLTKLLLHKRNVLGIVARNQHIINI
uniref:Uncharacterized protein n=1 Tax=Arundo donax TaxID=35708 RepID=A0A0A9FKM4_ARUDO